jgi:hypothetical protein
VCGLHDAGYVKPAHAHMFQQEGEVFALLLSPNLKPAPHQRKDAESKLESNSSASSPALRQRLQPEASGPINRR